MNGWMDGWMDRRERRRGGEGVEMRVSKRHRQTHREKEKKRERESQRERERERERVRERERERERERRLTCLPSQGETEGMANEKRDLPTISVRPVSNKLASNVPAFLAAVKGRSTRANDMGTAGSPSLPPLVVVP